MKLKIKRWKEQDDCTIGRLTYGFFNCFTLELPWLNNARNISCIPCAGAYIGKKGVNSKGDDVINIINVVDRTEIQIHKGNFTYQIKGCILVGDGVKYLDGDDVPDVTNSTETLNRLIKILPSEFEIDIS